MLSRAGSDANNRLRRAKSASSVQQRRAQPLLVEPIDPHTARIHAHVAAHRAMERSSERTSEELRRSNSNRNTQGITPRSPNIRFAAVTEPRTQRPIFQTRTSHVALTLRMPTESHNTDESIFAPTPTPSEFGASETYGAVPSSYRRLRKARSMLTPGKSGMSHQNPKFQSPMSTARTLRNVGSSIGSEEHGLRLGLKRSMSFIRYRSQALRRPQTEMGYQTEAVEMAREQFLRHHDLQHEPEQHSSSFRFKVRRPQKGFRKTVRSVRTTEFGDGVKSDYRPEDDPKPESKMRSISYSLRDRVKKVFGKPFMTKEDFPAQQLDASRPHFRDYIEDNGPDAGFDTYHRSDPDSVSRGSLYIPSQVQDETLEELDKISSTLHSSASRESLQSNSRSRVTSWTNSSATGRMTPLERNRLSIIKEDGGPHQPSSSAGRHLGGVSAFAEPRRSEDSSGHPIAPIDSQRVYSALCKRIDQEQIEMERTKAQLSAIHYEQNINNMVSQVTAPTIRAVQSEISLRDLAPDKEHRELSMGSDFREQCMTPQQIAQYGENIERRRARLALQEAQSSFFPFSGEIKPKTPSPFKLALVAQREKSACTDEIELDRGTETGSVVVRHPPAANNVHGKFCMSDESLYSRTTHGGSNALYRSPPLSPDQPADDFTNAGGMATIIPNRISRQPRPTPSLLQLHSARSNEKGEWKGWMEKQLNGLDRKASRASTRSHFREIADINGDDNMVGPCTDMRSRFGQRNINETTPTGPPLQRPPSAMNDRFPMLELKEVTRSNTPAPKSSGSMTKSWSGIMNKPGLTEKNDENKKLGTATMNTLRKISPKSIGNLLKSKKSQVLGQVGSTKGEGDSPPVSTPGRLYLQVAKSRQNGVTGGNEGLIDVTPTANRSRKNQISQEKYAFEEVNESHKDLSRLSRPFDMAVPEHNRPFDSMYLGKEDVGVLMGAGPGRLSVAPVKMLSGNRSPNSNSDFWDGFGREEREEGSSLGSNTALPRIVSGTAIAGKTGLGTNMSMGSKRLVSNFLRNRRKKNGTGQSEEAASSPAGAFL